MYRKLLLAGITSFGLMGTALAVDAEMLAAANAEGQVLIYSNMGDKNWGPVIEAFHDTYPEIKVENLEMGPAEVFSRYRAEAGTGVETADFMVAGSIVDWINASDDGLLSDYQSPEKANVPDWSYPLPGIYTFSTDPMVLLYNKALVTEDQRAATLAEYFANVVKYPETFDGKIGTYDGRYAFGGSINYAVTRAHGEEAWAWFEEAGKSIKPGGGSGGMIEKTLAGEWTSSYFVSGPSLFPRLKDAAAELLEWKFPEDGTPIFLRGMGITKQAPHSHAAQLFLDFVLSEAGQTAVSEGGLTPYRPGLQVEGDLRYSLDEIYDAIGGEENATLINYDRSMLTDEAAFSARWAAAFGI